MTIAVSIVQGNKGMKSLFVSYDTLIATLR